MANAVTKKQATDVAEWGDYAGATGFENVDRSELAIPFVNVLQSNSELVEDGKAKQGQFYNNVMETVMDDFRFIPCYRQRVFVEWVPVDSGGGFVGVHDPDSQFVQDAIRKNGNSPIKLQCHDAETGEVHDLVETIYLYGLVLDDDGDYERVVLGFSSMKLKKYRQFITKATAQTLVVGDRRIKLPLWAHVWRVTTEQEIAKSNGKKFQNISLSFDGGSAKDCRLAPNDDLFQAGLAFHDMVSEGAAKADLGTADRTDQAGGEENGGGNPTPDLDDDIPI